MGSNSNSEMSVSSRFLLADYVNYRLRKHGYTWDSCPPGLLPPLRGPTPKEAFRMRAMADEFEERYHQQFDDMCQQLHITPITAYSTFQAVLNELFSDGVINWGRIVALFSFSGALSIQSVDKEMPQLVGNILDWGHTYISQSLDPWITGHGGWNGFVEFCENGPENQNENPWPSLGRICALATGALGFLTIGAIMAQKS